MGAAAQRGTAAADFSKRAVFRGVALSRASLTDICAGAAGDIVQLRMPEHEIARRVGHLRAVEQYSDVLHAGIQSAFFQPVVDSSLTGVMDVFTRIDTLIHFGSLMAVKAGHVFRFLCLDRDSERNDAGA